MIDLKTKETELVTLVNQAKTLHAEIEQKGDKATAEDAQRLNALIEDGKAKRQALDSLKALAGLDDYTGTPVQEQKGKETLPTPDARKSWGQRVLESPEYKDAPTSGGQKRELPPVNIGNFKDFLARSKQLKAIYGSVDAAGGYATVADRQPEILDIARMRPKSVIDLVNQSTTNSDLVEYMVIASRTNNAAVVPERTASGGGTGDDVFGLKPESNMTLDMKTAAVKTVAAWIGASRQILNDAPRLRQAIDNELTYEVEIKLEDLLIADILAWSGIQSRVHAVSGARFDATDKIADTIRRAITDIVLEFYQPDGVVLNPAQGEEMELEKDANGQYLKMYDSATMRVWRVPVLETAAMAAGSGLVANFKLAVTVWDREQTQILTGQPNDYFLRNAWAILAELRFADAVTRPKAVEKITGM